ncbi:MAG: hypothetical protein B7Z47_07620, partial [Chthoniobacter sp. 12-60-6]
MEGVLGGQATDWEPPLAEELESCFPGYTDFRFIDRGGMGAVYSAMQNSLERRVAVKILPPDLGRDSLFVDGFHREARLLARLQHPNIVAVYDFGRNSLGHLFIVMEYVHGTSLFEILKQEQLAQEQEAAGKKDQFQLLRPRLDPTLAGSGNDAELAARLGMTHDAVRQSISRLRKRFREIMRDLVAGTLAAPTDEMVQEELTALRNALVSR